MTTKIQRPNSGGLSLLRKKGKKHFKMIASLRWAKYREQKEAWEKTKQKGDK